MNTRKKYTVLYFAALFSILVLSFKGCSEEGKTIWVNDHGLIGGVYKFREATCKKPYSDKGTYIMDSDLIATGWVLHNSKKLSEGPLSRRGGCLPMSVNFFEVVSVYRSKPYFYMVGASTSTSAVLQDEKNRRYVLPVSRIQSDMVEISH